MSLFPPAPTRPLPAAAATAPAHLDSCGRQRGRGRLGIVTAAAASASAPPPTPPPLLPLPLPPPLPLPQTLSLTEQHMGGETVEEARMVGGRRWRMWAVDSEGDDVACSRKKKLLVAANGQWVLVGLTREITIKNGC
ncbi:hypothetical protein I4F81_003463 [Pyropia yezoensis]|uniref:Uncharacterized protein n=1 Tax=Pyropia yezoensis TaxID=2788 RepID=A0ACC3BTP7_PYRYE|nr:hypothetical protein I4F81_003463 [Neopyropia yezoensis]